MKVEVNKNNSINVFFDYGFQETFGGHSLVGAISRELINKGMEVELENLNIFLFFYDPDLNWLHKNNGPYLEIMPSYFPFVLINEILYLISIGCKFKVEVINKNPEE